MDEKLFDLVFKIAAEMRAEMVDETVGETVWSISRDHGLYYMGGTDAIDEFEKRFKEQAGALGNGL